MDSLDRLKALGFEPTNDNIITPAPNYGNCPRCGLYFGNLTNHFRACRDLGAQPACACGCGHLTDISATKPYHWNRYINGHNSRQADHDATAYYRSAILNARAAGITVQEQIRRDHA